MEELYNTYCDEEMVMTPADWKVHNAADKCYLCEEDFTCQLAYKEWQGEMFRMQNEREVEALESGEEHIENNDDPFLKGPKVRDHDHWTGAYRGPAHATCNLKLKPNFRIPVFFHNLSGQ